MQDTSLRVSVNATSAAEANRLTSDLEAWIRKNVNDINLIRVKEDSESQDFGTVLVAILSAPAVIALSKGPALELAKGIADWLRKRRATISIGVDGCVKAENVAADDVERIILGVLKVQAKTMAATRN